MNARPGRRSATRARSLRHDMVVLAAALAALSLPPRPVPAAPGESLEGVIEMSENGQVIPGAGGSIVSFEPEGGSPRSAPRTVEIDTRGKRFLPRVTAVPRGSTVGFPNRDPIFHNVFSVSPGNRFDLGRYREGESRSTRFDQPGLVRVYCNVHEQMVAYVLVLETPYHAVADEEGRFRLAGLPPGRGTLVIWNERSGARRVPVEIPAREPIRVRLEATLARDAPHLNKFGRPYGSESQDAGYR